MSRTYEYEYSENDCDCKKCRKRECDSYIRCDKCEKRKKKERCGKCDTCVRRKKEKECCKKGCKSECDNKSDCDNNCVKCNKTQQHILITINQV